MVADGAVMPVAIERLHTLCLCSIVDELERVIRLQSGRLSAVQNGLRQSPLLIRPFLVVLPEMRAVLRNYQRWNAEAGNSLHQWAGECLAGAGGNPLGVLPEPGRVIAKVSHELVDQHRPAEPALPERQALARDRLVGRG